MFKRKNTEAEWKTETQRQAREERLKKQKNAKGEKKPIKQEKNLFSIISLIILAVVVVGMVVWGAFQYGLPQKYQKAFEVKAKDNQSPAEEISVKKANLYFGIMAQSLAKDGVFSPAGQAALDKPSSQDAQKKLRDDVLEAVRQQLKRGAAFNQSIRQENFSPNQDQLDQQVDNFIKQLNAMAGQKQMSLGNFLSLSFGPGTREQEVRDLATELFTSAQFQQAKMESFQYDEDQIKASYQEQPDKYDVVAYRSYSFKPEEPAKDSKEKQTDEEKQAAKDKAKAEADQFAEEITDEDSFKAKVLEYVEDGKRKEYAEKDSSLTQGAYKERLTQALGDWLFSSDRQSGDKTVLETTNGYQVVMFMDRHRPEDQTFSSRHILIKIGENQTEDQAKEKIEQIKQEFESSDKSSEAFAKLAEKYSEDTGSAAQGGLVAKAQSGQLVPEYEAFCMAEGRQQGDYDVVKTRFGYHLIYFEGYDGAVWQAKVANDLRSEDYQKWLKEATDQFEVADLASVSKVGK